jgi:predicted DNA-binding transcriptional regulator AlpA
MDLLTAVEVAELLGVSVHTLSNWRHKNVGPPHIKLVGAVRYSGADVEAWLASNAVDPSREGAI